MGVTGKRDLSRLYVGLFGFAFCMLVSAQQFAEQNLIPWSRFTGIAIGQVLLFLAAAAASAAWDSIATPRDLRLLRGVGGAALFVVVAYVGVYGLMALIGRAELEKAGMHLGSIPMQILFGGFVGSSVKQFRKPRGMSSPNSGSSAGLQL